EFRKVATQNSTLKTQNSVVPPFQRREELVISVRIGGWGADQDVGAHGGGGAIGLTGAKCIQQRIMVDRYFGEVAEVSHVVQNQEPLHLGGEEFPDAHETGVLRPEADSPMQRQICLHHRDHIPPPASLQHLLHQTLQLLNAGG